MMTQTAVLIGGNGQVARLLTQLLVDSGRRVVAVIRDPEQEEQVRRRGATPLVFDLERGSAEQLAEHLPAGSVVYFVAGAGPGSGPRRKETVDLAGALLSMSAAKIAGARVIQLSYIGVENTPSPGASEDFLAYQRAKYAADLALQQSAVPWVIVRPSRLTDEAPTSRVQLGEGLPQGHTSRANTAALLAELLDRPDINRAIIDVLDGVTPLTEALGAWRPSSQAVV